MSVRRLTVAVQGVVFSFGFAVAQELPRELPSEQISNWTAPPFWTPPRVVEFEKLNEAGALEPMALETVPTGPLPFFGIQPCRIVDTRPSSGFTGAYGPPAMVANASRDFDLNSAPHCPGIPVNAEAYSINVTVTETTGLGDIRLWPAGSPPAVFVSTQNWPTAGLSIANAAIVPAGTNGAITVYVAGSATHLIIDINGYYAPISIVNTVNGLSGAVTLAAGSKVTITPSGNTLTIASSGGEASGWSLTGNSGTNPASNFLGTTDNQALEVRVNNVRALRIQPNATSPSIIGGFSGNAVGSAVGATIAGGGATSLGNGVFDDFGTVGGGRGNSAGTFGGGASVDATVAGGLSNQATGAGSTVGGGGDNAASGNAATVGGGNLNTASGFLATVAGGRQNTASETAATVGGGDNNTASGALATVPGGSSNTASGAYGFAAGHQAKAMHGGAFVWGDSTAADVASTGSNQFIVRAAGHIWLGTNSTPTFNLTDFINTSTGAHLTITGIWTNNSDRESKEDFLPVDGEELLGRLANLPISTWHYKIESRAVRHLGPTAQDFSAAFGLGTDDRSIGTLDAEGVSLAAVKTLYTLVRDRDREIEALRERLAKIEATLP